MGRWGSVRLRTTVGATLIVALALLAGAALLLVLQRSALADGLETTAEQRAESLATQIEESGLPESLGESDPDDEDDDPEDIVIVIRDSSGAAVLASQPIAKDLPRDSAESFDLRGADHDYLVTSEDADSSSGEYVVTVGVSREDVDESTSALLPLLAVGVPIVLLVVGATTWIVVGRALAPVERIRREVDQIGGAQLGRRVPLPAARDEIHRLATTMNAMLDRLEASRDRQRRFVSDASHELRSPLASLRQTAEVSIAHPGALPEGELADAVMEEGLRMQRLVDQLLLLTRADEGQSPAARQEVDLDDLALTEVQRLRPLVAPRGVEVTGSAIGAARVNGDQVALAQVLRNLVDNAARHARSRIELSVSTEAGMARVSVDDDGSGVPEQERERIFERFVRLDEARARDDGGSGLGLAIVREIAVAHGGGASVEASPLGGARFVVWLPLA